MTTDKEKSRIEFLIRQHKFLDETIKKMYDAYFPQNEVEIMKKKKLQAKDELAKLGITL